MPKTLKLSDLYVVGKEFTVTAPEGEVVVWLQKLSPIDHETALRRANARRASVLSIARLSATDPRREEIRESYMNELFDIAPDRDAMLDFLANEKMLRVYGAREAEVASRDEWSEDDYIQGLKDAWNSELAEIYASEPDNEEAKRVFNELKRFDDEVNKEIMSEREAVRKDFDSWNDDKLTAECVNKLIESAADLEWLQEYRKCEIWKGVRDPKSKKPYFADRSEVDQLSAQVLGELINAFASLNIDVIEGKD